MIIALMCVYNEEKNIKKAVESIVNYVDGVHIYDGAYGDYPCEERNSTDNTINIIKELMLKYDNIEYFPDMQYDDQIDKRNQMFTGLFENDIAFIFDGDEYCSNPEMIRQYENENFDVAWGWSKSNLYSKPYMTPRLIRYQNGFHYYGKHSIIIDENSNLVTSHQYKNDAYKHINTQITVWNMRQINGKDRENNKKIYRNNRNTSEIRYKEADFIDNKSHLKLHSNRAGTPRQPAEVLKNSEKLIKYSLIIPISRPWAIQPWFTQLDSVELPKGIEVVCIVDSNNTTFYNMVKEQLIIRNERFETIKIILTGNDKLNCHKNVEQRRERIIENWNIFLTEITGDIILGFEDDTTPDPDAYTKLLKILKKENADFVQGTEVGRWHAKIIPHWKIIENKGQITEIHSAWYGDRAWYNKNIIDIDGGGWYCFVGKTDAFRRVIFRHSINPPLGPDLCFVWDLKKLGYKCLGVWDIKCWHYSDDSRYHQDFTPIHYISRKLNDNGEWEEKIFDMDNKLKPKLLEKYV